MKDLLTFEVVDLSEIVDVATVAPVDGGGCGCSGDGNGGCGCPPPEEPEELKLA